jgi:predicted metal-dependent phosphoesterase TrpH
MRSTDELVLAADAAIDLQLHTTYSDGRWTPETLIAHLRAEAFGLAAITDHDRVDTAAAIQQVAVAQQFPVLVAAELTTRWNGGMTDVLCYGFDPEHGALAKLAGDVLQRQRENTREVYEHLVRTGHIEQVQGELERILSTPSAQQVHEIVALLQQSGREREASVGEVLKKAGFTWATNEIAAVAEAVHHDGGVCLIAHPGRADFTVYDVPLLDALRREVPIDGLEVYYPAHTADQIAMYAAYAEEHRLLVSSGSDSHRPDKPPIKYRAALSRNLLERVGIAIR